MKNAGPTNYIGRNTFNFAGECDRNVCGAKAYYGLSPGIVDLVERNA